MGEPAHRAVERREHGKGGPGQTVLGGFQVSLNFYLALEDVAVGVYGVMLFHEITLRTGSL